MIARACQPVWWRRRRKHRAHPKCDGWWESPHMAGSCDCNCHALSSTQMAALVARMERDLMIMPGV